VEYFFFLKELILPPFLTVYSTSIHRFYLMNQSNPQQPTQDDINMMILNRLSELVVHLKNLSFHSSLNSSSDHEINNLSRNSSSVSHLNVGPSSLQLEPKVATPGKFSGSRHEDIHNFISHLICKCANCSNRK
jgi:hypothetical protein